MGFLDFADKQYEKKKINDRLNKCRAALAKQTGKEYTPWYAPWGLLWGTSPDALLDPLPDPPARGGVRKTRKASKRVWNNSDTVWGKNPALEHFWGDLASGKRVVLIYKDKTHKYVNLPSRTTKKYQTMLNEFRGDNNVAAILSSNPSQDAYEVYLYPKATSKSVDYVIQHYNTYFKPIVPGEKLRVPL